VERTEKLDFLVGELAELGTEYMVDSNMVSISTRRKDGLVSTQFDGHKFTGRTRETRGNGQHT